MASEEPSLDPPPDGPVAVHDATSLLQEFLELSDRFTRLLGRELDVNATDYRAMEHLLRAGPLTPGDLARRLGVSGAAVTTAVDRLVARGHVRRAPDPADRRRVRVIPSATSSQRATDLVMPMILGLDAQLDGFSEAEQATITAYLGRIIDTLRPHADGGA